MRGKFIVLEGIDGAGGETQSKILFERLTKEGFDVVLLRYPDREGEIGKLIYKHLEKREIFPPEALALLYIADKLKDKKKILKLLEEGKIVIADRYFTSTLVYQHVQGIDQSKILKIGEIFELPKPDIAILIKISPETSMKRKKLEKGDLDNFEKNMEFMKKVSETYEITARNNVFCKWEIIDGEKSIEEVSQDIWRIVKSILNL